MGTQIDEIALLDSIQKKLLWLSTYMIHYANFLRHNDKKEKIGGHQASCASLVTIMTVLFFKMLRGNDKVAVKPHASPLFHAIQFLKGRLSSQYLKTLRQFGGLQAYPSRTKDPDGVQISTGSLGMGAVAASFGALTDVIVNSLFETNNVGRYISIVGDAELDEGNVWEAIQERNLANLNNILWIVDLNRQSLDRVVPSGKAQQIEKMFETNNWHLIEVKYGSNVEEVFAKPNGHLLKKRIDLMENEEYQALLILPGSEIRAKLPETPDGQFRGIAELLKPYNDDEIKSLLFDLGGHDLRKVTAAFEEAEKVQDKPVVIIAYTIKGWGLPTAADPMNHALLLTSAQIEGLRSELGIEQGEELSGFPEDSPEALYIRRFEQAFEQGKTSSMKKSAHPGGVPSIPQEINPRFHGILSTQQAFGSILMNLTKFPELAQRTVTVSPDVSVSTNIGGWVNEMGVFAATELVDYYQNYEIFRMLKWRESPKGHHIELGISENNLFLLLTMLGLSAELTGERLIPIGTIYDVFIKRGLDALVYGAYSGARFIIVGTPSGISLSPEGGSHQSLIAPSLGIQTPNVVYCEPCFGRELEWIFLESVRRILTQRNALIVYLRLSTKSIPQELFQRYALQNRDEPELRKMVIKGGYRLIDHSGNADYDPRTNVVNIFASGVMVPEAIKASTMLKEQNIFANVINVTSPDLLYQGFYLTRNLNMKDHDTRAACHVATLIPPRERRVPLITVMDGHPHALSFLGSIFGAEVLPLGVIQFGQSGSQKDLYNHYDINESAIVQAAAYMVNRRRSNEDPPRV